MQCLQLMLMREVMLGDKDNPKASMQNNKRPIMPVHHRPIRTNINFQNTVSLFHILLPA